MMTNTTPAFNYSFPDYGESTDMHPHSIEFARPALKATILVATKVSMLFLLILLIKTKSNGHRAFRWYAANLLIVNFVTMMIIAANEKDLAFAFRPYMSSSTFARAKAYNFDIVELSNIVYCSTTFFLIADSTYRYRRNGPGFSTFNWFLITVLNDLIPLKYIIIQHEYFPYSTLKPKPLAVWHLIYWTLFNVASCSFITASLCCLKKRKKEEYAVDELTYPEDNTPAANTTFSKTYNRVFQQNVLPSFNHRHLIRLSLFLLFTAWIQFPTSSNVGPDLMSEPISADTGAELMPKIQPYIKTILNIIIWSTFCMPLLQTLGCLIFLPSFGDLFCYSSDLVYKAPHIPPISTKY